MDPERGGYVYIGPVLDRCSTSEPGVFEWIRRWRSEGAEILLSIDHKQLIAVPPTEVEEA